MPENFQGKCGRSAKPELLSLPHPSWTFFLRLIFDFLFLFLFFFFFDFSFSTLRAGNVEEENDTYRAESQKSFTTFATMKPLMQSFSSGIEK